MPIKKTTIPSNRQKVRTIKLNTGTLTAEADNNGNLYWFRNGKYITPDQLKSYKYYDSSIGGYRRLSDKADLEGNIRNGVYFVADKATPVYTPTLDSLKNVAHEKGRRHLALIDEQTIPFSGQDYITLRTKGSSNLADVPISLLDSIAVNSGRAGTPFWEGLALTDKESTFGGFSHILGNAISEQGYSENAHNLVNNHAFLFSPEDEYLSASRNKFGTEDKDLVKAEKDARWQIQHGDISRGARPNYSDYVMADAFMRFNKDPYNYNYGQKNYVPMVRNLQQELQGEKQLQEYWNTKGKEQYKRGTREGPWITDNPKAYGGSIQQIRKEWSDLSPSEKAEIMRVGIRNGIKDLIGIREAYNEFAEGGKIHIDPSKKGTFTAAASRHGKSVQEFASQVLAHPENYSPAMRKKANFARNSSHWHKNGGHLYSGEKEPTQQMNRWGQTGWNPLTLDELNLKAIEEEWRRKAALEAQLKNTRAEMQRRNRDYLTTSNDNTTVSSGKPQNEHLEERFSEGAKAQELWTKDHPNAAAWSTALGAAPFVVASLPALAAGGAGLLALGDAAASTAAGTALTGALNSTVGTVLGTSVLGVPLSTWGLTGLDAAMVAHGANSVRQGEFTPMTALELLPATKIAKPAVKMGTKAARETTTLLQNKYPALFDPYTSWDATLGYHGDNIFSRAIGTIGRRHGLTPKAEIPEFHRRMNILNRSRNPSLDFNLTEDGRLVLSGTRVGEGHDGIVNFATSEPARAHSRHKLLSGIDDFIISPKAIGNANWKSIQPSDTFAEFSNGLTVNPNDVTFVSGNTELLERAKNIGIKTLSSPKLRQLHARNSAPTVGILNRVEKSGGLSSEIGSEIQRLTSMRGAPTMGDYAYFENLTGLNSGVVPSFKWTGTNGMALFGREGSIRRIPVFNNVAYDPATNIEYIYRKAKIGEIPWSDYYEALEKMPSASEQLGMGTPYETLIQKYPYLKYPSQKSLGGHLYGRGSYKPSKQIRDRIAAYEGKSMTGAIDPLSGKYYKNNSFEAEASGFYKALPESIRVQVLSNPELADNLYSYSYNVGAGNFKNRVVPALEKYYAGIGTAEDVANSMWASGDSKLRGLQRRRAEEKTGVLNALGWDSDYDDPYAGLSAYVDEDPEYAPWYSQVPEVDLEPTQPLVEAANEYSQEALDAEQRQNSFDILQMVLSMNNNKGSNTPLLDAINMMRGNYYADGGEKETNLGFWGNTAVKAARLFGLDKKYKGDKDDFQYRENIYNMVNPVAGVPTSVPEVIKYKRIADDARSGKKYPYTRTHTEPGAEAAWAKRLGLPYDKGILLDNADGSVRLSSELEKEIPTDTLFLKDRIQKNKDLLEYNRKHRIYNKDRNDAIEAGLKADNDALNALRETYKTGKPVVLNEYSHVNRHWINNGMVDPYKLTPLSLMQNYTVRYDKNSDTMEYSDIYDFNGLEDFVPGEPFDIRGRIKLGNRKK